MSAEHVQSWLAPARNDGVTPVAHAAEGVDAEGDARRRVRAVVGWGLVGVAVVSSALALRVEARTGYEVSGSLGAALVLLLAAVAFAAVGAVIVQRRPGNRVGWMMAVAGATLSLGIAVDVYALAVHLATGEPPTSAVWATWFASWTWAVPIFLVFVFIPLFFPDGRLPSPRWKPVAIAGMLLAVYPLTAAVGPGPMLQYDGVDVTISDNPFGIPALGPIVETLDRLEGLPLVAVTLAVVASLAVRWRRSRGVERQQLKWFFAAAAALATGFLLSLLLPVPDVLFGLVLLAMPTGIGIAVLRYRLYDIDRIIRRTVAYAVLVALLVGIYAVGVLTMGWVVRSLTGGAGGDAVVAASTLAVAAAFGPLRRRLQVAVDRRFDRARYDAQRTVEGFSHRLRGDVAIDAALGELMTVTGTALRPAGVSVWLFPSQEVDTRGSRSARRIERALPWEPRGSRVASLRLPD
jgi:hypothetical protein